MDTVKLKVSAKINLTLDVTGKREDGYHNIESIFQSVGKYDTITVKKLDTAEIIITGDDPDMPCDQRNIAYKAAELFYRETGIQGGVAMHIEKKIPSQAGLGGGSSDGAGVLYAMNRLYNTHLNGRKLTELGGKVSADTAFFTVGGTAYVSGIGEKIQSVRYIPKVNLVIAKGASGISTPEAYKKIDMLTKPHHPDTRKLLKAIDDGKFIEKCELCENLFEAVTETDDVTNIKAEMTDMGAINAIMSGSGSSVFGIFPDKDSALSCAQRLKERYPFAEYCRAEPESIIIL